MNVNNLLKATVIGIGVGSNRRAAYQFLVDPKTLYKFFIFTLAVF